MVESPPKFHFVGKFLERNVTMNPRSKIAYGIAIAVGGLLLLVFRPYNSIGLPIIDLALVVIVTAIVLAPLFSEVSFGGFTFKHQIKKSIDEVANKISDLQLAISTSSATSSVHVVQQMVQREVSLARAEALRAAARIDAQMVPIWESLHCSIPQAVGKANQQRIDLLEAEIARFEAALAGAEPADRWAYAEVLRRFYWELMEAARMHWASTQRFQDVKRRVQARFEALATLQ
jgi:hypothetical protein